MFLLCKTQKCLMWQPDEEKVYLPRMKISLNIRQKKAWHGENLGKHM